MAALRSFRRRFLPFIPPGGPLRVWRRRWAHRLGLVRMKPAGVLDAHEELTFDSLLAVLVEAYRRPSQPFRFLQIGAYDGVMCDHLNEVVRDGSCQGVFVEPQATAFARLKQTYENVPGLTFMNVAIDKVSGQRAFYTTRNQDSLLASFDKSMLLKHNIAETEIISTSVPCMTVADVIAEANLDSVDLLQIDAEGHDWQIIKSIDFTKFRPSILRFEFHHLSRTDRAVGLEHLSRFGYRFLVEKMDIIALQPLNLAQRRAA